MFVGKKTIVFFCGSWGNGGQGGAGLKKKQLFFFPGQGGAG